MDSGVGATTVDFVVTMTADSGGPWTFGYSLPVALPTAPSAVALLADVNRDGIVGIADILTIATVLGEDATTHPRADLNGDQALDIADMVVVEVARYDGLIDEFYIFSRALTADEVTAVMDDEFLSVEAAGKATTTWARVKSQ